ncbi:MAG: cell division protein FtsA, partial [Candidatus Eremiobacteraeota bacterium]|nr:cell division protein FtsA [Candidatus Eremiobacteraeota bacterium]
NVPRDLVLGEVVLTGGGAQLPNIESLAEDVFGLPVRVGMPNTVGGLTDAMALPQYSTAIGLVLFGVHDEHDAADHNRRRSGSIMHRVTKWMSDLWN